MKKNKKIVALLALVMMTCVSQSVVLNAQEEPTEEVKDVEMTKEQASETQDIVATVNPKMEEKGVLKVNAETRGSDVSTLAEGDIEINEENFPDATFRDYVINKLNGGSTTLTTAKLNTITKIDVENKAITNLKGIEYFTALTELSCGINQLTSLDVSKNTALEALVCDQNQLTNLDVSKNTALTDLYCYNNSLTSLDVSKNTRLIQFACNNNQLTSLDVSKNMLLSTFFAGNQSVTIDIEEGKDSIDLKTLNSKIDTSKMSSLRNATLNGNILSNLKYGEPVTYNYDCGNGQTLGISLTFKIPTPDIVEPSGLKLKEGKTLSEIVLPTGWTWVNPATVATISTRSIHTYPARLAVDDVKYNYTGVSGYNATGHYVERDLNVNVIQNPVINPDGSTTIFPGDTITTPGGGSIDLPNGGELKPDGSMNVKPGGSITTPDGTITLPEGGTIKPDGSIVVKPGGSIVTPDETITFPNGGSLNADGTITKSEDPNKPSVGNSAKSDSNVKTGDQSNQKGLLALLGMSAIMILNSIVKRNKETR